MMMEEGERKKKEHAFLIRVFNTKMNNNNNTTKS
jgi:hypothetical protein